MANKFSPSTNILRDSNRVLNYIPTPNAKRVVKQLEENFSNGLHTFNLIGSYGTGKSTFLWALEQSLLKQKEVFKTCFFQNQKVEVFKLVGKYGSFATTLANRLNVDSEKSEDILSEFYNHYYKLQKENIALVVFIDEFGKFLEYAAKYNPENELYFLQELAEFINDPVNNTILITAVHQNIDAYAFGLTSAQRQEWTKVKGRFKEITFNEPVEQLLYLAAESLQGDKIISNEEKKKIKKAFVLLEESKAFNINPIYANEIAQKLFPLDLISANVLTLTLQKYGQNERSLFTFLETEAKLKNDSSSQFFHLGEVYDYLINNFYSFLNSRYNPDFAAWVSLKNAIEAVELQLLGNHSDATKIIKVIGLLNLTANYGSVLDKSFLTTYASAFQGIKKPEDVITELEKKKIIIFRAYNSKFSLFEGTDLDITEALTLAENKISDVVDVVGLLQKEYNFSPLLAKSYSYKTGTPRLFEFLISEYPSKNIPEGETDGFINLIFNNSLIEKDIFEHSNNQSEAILYGYFKNYDSIKNQLFEIEKTRKVIEENIGDKVAIKELSNILDHQKRLLNHYVINNLYNANPDISWVFNGKKHQVVNKKEFNKLLSTISFEVYSKTPQFKNELVNRHKISSTIHTAKKNFFKALYYNWEQPDLGFEESRFPPEKTIYLTLLKENGLEPYTEDIFARKEKLKNSTFTHVWIASLEFLESTRKNKRPISELSQILSKRPFKLKQGVTDFWMASFLYLNRNDFALFGESGYIPYLTDEILELVIKYPSEYQMKAFDLEGVKLDLFNSYRVFLNQAVSEKPSNDTFIETVKPFLVFYRDLKPFAKETKRLSKPALAIRLAIASSKEPEKTFFEDFPMALGYSISGLQDSQASFNAYIEKLQSAIIEIRKSLENLYDRLEEFIQDEILGEKLEFEEYKAKLQLRYGKVKRHLCLPYQKTFLMRIDSPLDERNLWLSSIAQSLIGAPLENINDNQEIRLYEKFKEVILELDSLNRIGVSGFDEEKEDVIEIEMSSFGNEKSKNLIRLPKSKIKEVEGIHGELEKSLSGDKRTDIYALASLLKKLMDQ
ncbi:hypothetical protein [Cognataquiflexum aquatile]|uniref:hypothetical protein n=1 Tax=Cognataquiflexum aquatile TaxID=2249427 RepID=UPI000DE9EF6B|nr:hypothetical protein [Cognataquiflexum aquatile]